MVGWPKLRYELTLNVTFLIANKMQDLVSWNNAELKNPRSIKGIIGELVACLGPEAAWQVVVELG